MARKKLNEKEIIKEKNLVLLLGKTKCFLIRVEKGKRLNTDEGLIDINEIIGKKYGDIIKTHKNISFVLVKPSIIDFLNKKARMMPQAIRPKDSALILAFTGLKDDAHIVEGGLGSGWLTLFLASYCQKGKIYSYEIRKDFLNNAKNNILESGLKNIVIKNKDITKGIDEKNVDAVILDMKNAEKVVKHAYKALKFGGWLIVFSPYIEQVKAINEEIKKYSFTQVFTVENILRYWDVREHTLPKRQGLLHTGFLTFARKTIKN
ncbi:MAG: tRNA (adenine-N1)-methyltransferase [Candidatus Pacearchaeota archaeon]